MQAMPHNVPLDAWKIPEEDFPSREAPERQLEFLLRYAILAPSTHNTQPWRFRIRGATLEVLADYDRSLPIADPQDRELIMSCGAALFNLRTAMHYFGCASEARPFPDAHRPGVVARVALQASSGQKSEWSELFHAIPRRMTDRGRYSVEAVSGELQAQMCEVARIQGAWLAPFASTRSKEMVADLIATGDRAQFENRAFRAELASWLRSPRDNDGLPAHAKGARQLLGVAIPAVAFLVRTFDLGNGVAARDRALATGSPLLACLGTARDTALDWLNAGQALQRVLLTVTANGLHASFLNQPIEVKELRSALGSLCGQQGYPQVLLRIGRGSGTRHTPRRPVSEVLLH